MENSHQISKMDSMLNRHQLSLHLPCKPHDNIIHFYQDLFAISIDSIKKFNLEILLIYCLQLMKMLVKFYSRKN